ncbi:MAG: ABC transporter permease [Pseudomonadota bacterium]
MNRYLLIRTALILPTLLGVSLVTFALIHAAPGGPLERAVTRMLQDPMIADQAQLTPAILENLRSHYQFDKPLLDRYLSWLSRISQWNLGESDLYRRPVSEVMGPRLWRSAVYGFWALPTCYLLAFFWSLVHLSCRKEWVRGVSILTSALLYCLPPLVLALGLKYVLGSGTFFVVVLGYVLSHLAMMVLLFRGALLEESEKEYVKVAKAKGLSDSEVVRSHTLRNALIPIVTSLSYSVMAFFSGALFLEVVFQIDGLGMLSYKAALARDYNLMMGIIILVACLFVVARWISDLLFLVVDPRLRRAQ